MALNSNPLNARGHFRTRGLTGRHSIPRRPLSRWLLSPVFLIGTAFLLQSCATEIQKPAADTPPEDPQWMTSAQFQQVFDRKVADGFYPYEIDGKCENGYEQFSAKWTGLPLGWYFYARHGAFEAPFERFNQDYLSKGFTLEFSSTFEDCAGKTRYQGVWLKQP